MAKDIKLVENKIRIYSKFNFKYFTWQSDPNFLGLSCFITLILFYSINTLTWEIIFTLPLKPPCCIFLDQGKVGFHLLLILMRLTGKKKKIMLIKIIMLFRRTLDYHHLNK